MSDEGIGVEEEEEEEGEGSSRASYVSCPPYGVHGFKRTKADDFQRGGKGGVFVYINRGPARLWSMLSHSRSRLALQI